MLAVMLELFYLLAGLQILAGLYLAADGVRWLAYLRQRMRSHSGFYAPRVAVLCPCKGLEAGLEQNLRALCEFDYPNYEVFFILAAAADPAHGILQRVIEGAKNKAHMVIAGAPVDCGEKVNNLRVALEQLPEEFEVFVFADSDGRPGRHWLQQLVAPLNDPKLGAATTMRWFLPARDNLATALLAAWNAPVVTLLGNPHRNFCWGGGTAIRRDVFLQARIYEEWRTSLSDDYSMTRMLQHAGKPILFVPECLTPSFPATDFAGLLEFTNRQMLITRVYAPNMWWRAVATHLLYCATLLLGAGLVLSNLIAARPALHLAMLTLFPLVLATIRGVQRTTGVSELLPAWKAQIMDLAWVWTLLALVVPFLYLLNFAATAFTRTLRWRGIRYRLISPNQTKILPG
ncbi:MAG: glycosyltransferase [Acidobacteriia bacterium]|nr:glycosyltransferase [Terriglobia bacterium]